MIDYFNLPTMAAGTSNFSWQSNYSLGSYPDLRDTNTFVWWGMEFI